MAYSSRRSITWLLILAGLDLAVTGCGGRPAAVVYPSEPDARDLLATTVRLAQAGKIQQLCDTVAASPANCRHLVESAEAMKVKLDRNEPRVTRIDKYGRQGASPTLVLRLAGTHADGKSYNSDFAVIDDNSGQAKSLTPIYWSEVKFLP